MAVPGIDQEPVSRAGETSGNYAMSTVTAWTRLFRADKRSSISVYELRSGYALPAAAKPSETLRAKERMKLGRPLQG